MLFIGLQEEIPIFEAFSDESFVGDFLKSLSFEEKKGEDKFHTTNFSLFKVIKISFKINKFSSHRWQSQVITAN